MTVNLTTGDTPKLYEACSNVGLTKAQIAYVLATAYWETNQTMKPVKEAYFLGSKAEAYRKKLKYYPYYGRGYVQLTWKENYKKASVYIDADFVGLPDLAEKTENAVKITAYGMRDGWFTGKTLSNYINKTKIDYVNARRIINGLDSAQDIAKIANDYYALLEPAPKDMIGRGSIGSSVTFLQNLLIKAGYMITADGVFGDHTELSVKHYQAKNGLTVDGIVGPATWAKLEAQL